MRKLMALLLGFLTFTLSAEEIPIWKFFELFELGQVQISPEGTYLAASLFTPTDKQDEWDNKFQIVNRSTGEIAMSFAMPEKNRISSITWIRDNEVLVSPARKVPNEDAYRPTGGLMKVLVETGKTIDLPSSGVFNQLIDEPDHTMVLRIAGRYAELFKMHVQSGALQKIARAPALGFGFVLTPDLQEPAFHVGSNDEGDTLVHKRLPTGDWELVESFGIGEKGWTPTGPAFKPNEYFTRDTRNRAGIAALGIYNVETGEHTKVFQDETFDISVVARDYQGNAWGLGMAAHFPIVRYLNPSHPLAQHHKTINRQFPEASILLSSYTKDYNLVIATIVHANAIPEVVLLDATKGTIDQITNRAADLDMQKERLAKVEPFEFSARDGTVIHGYLTMHKDTPTPGPTIVRVHGGPFNIRDGYGFDGFNQLFASRGYHILQINFRGSGGRGTEFVKSGWREYGGAMLDDVIDGTKWAIQVGVADKDSICITGGSYGAYAAVMGAAAEPDLYQCVIGSSGLYDVAAVERMGDLARSKASIKYLRLTMGRNREEREAVSALNFAHKINAPVLLLHGGQDRRTPPEHYHRMLKVLEDSGKQVDTWYKGNQGHGWIGRDTIMEVYSKQLNFLAENIGGGGASSTAVSAAN